jgi:hypothetical protein
MVVNDQHPDYVAWRTTLTPEMRIKVDGAINAGMAKSVSSPSSNVIHVIAGDGDDWNSNPPRLCLATATDYLKFPFRLFVENSRADKAFILSFFAEPQLVRINEALKKGWLVVVHGGGLGDLLNQLREEMLATGFTKRSFVFFDSDARQPGIPSAQSKRLAEHCAENAISFYQLARRYIENYIPIQALQNWCNSQSGKKRNDLSQCLAALLALPSPEQRYHFHMKRGFRRDALDRSRTSGNLYTGVPNWILSRLQEGFGDSLSDLYQSGVVYNREIFEEREAVREMEPVVLNILRLL